MKTIDLIKRELPLWIIMTAPVVYMLIVWDQLPQKLPMHWNVNGEIDRYGSRYILPLFMLGIYLLMLIVPKIDPERYNYKYFSKVYYILRIMFLTFFSIMHFVVITSGLGVKLNVERIVVSGIFIMLIMTGNYMGNIKFNRFVGFKTPWILTNETNWRKTHFMAGKVWFWVCLLAFALSFLFTGRILFYFLMVVICTIIIIPTIYSYRIYKSGQQ